MNIRAQMLNLSILPTLGTIRPIPDPVGLAEVCSPLVFFCCFGTLSNLVPSANDCPNIVAEVSPAQVSPAQVIPLVRNQLG